jgi:hypothetical protein
MVLLNVLFIKDRVVKCFIYERSCCSMFYLLEIVMFNLFLFCYIKWYYLCYLVYTFIRQYCLNLHVFFYVLFWYKMIRTKHSLDYAFRKMCISLRMNDGSITKLCATSVLYKTWYADLFKQWYDPGLFLLFVFSNIYFMLL